MERKRERETPSTCQEDAISKRCEDMIGLHDSHRALDEIIEARPAIAGWMSRAHCMLQQAWRSATLVSSPNERNLSGCASWKLSSISRSAPSACLMSCFWQQRARCQAHRQRGHRPRALPDCRQLTNLALWHRAREHRQPGELNRAQCRDGRRVAASQHRLRIGGSSQHLRRRGS
jgi:hypothetical protein